MSNAEQQVVADALALPVETRAALAEQLLASLEEVDQKDVDAAWAEEAEARIDAYERGEIEAIPAAKVFRDMGAGPF